MRRLFLIFSIVFSAISLAFGQSYEDYVKKSFEAIDHQDWTNAEICLKAAMHLEPANPLNYTLLTNLGTVQRNLGKLEDALISYNAALSVHPKNILILSNRATLYSTMNEIDKALSDYNIIIAEDSSNQEALYSRGLIYVEKRNYLQAEQDFDHIMRINDKTVNGRIGYAILEKMRGNYNESERIFNYLISQLPKYWTLYEGRADLYFTMGNNKRAMSDINKVFANGKPSASLYVLRGKISLTRYDKEGAALDFQKAKTMGYDKDIITKLLKMTTK